MPAAATAMRKGRDRFIDARHKDREFLAAHATKRIVRPDCRPDRLGDADQRLVAVIVAERVVDALEVIDIDNHQRRSIRHAAIAGALPGLHARDEGAAVEAPRQAVGIGKFLKSCPRDGKLADLPLEHAEDRNGENDRDEDVVANGDGPQLAFHPAEIRVVEEKRHGDADQRADDRHKRYAQPVSLFKSNMHGRWSGMRKRRSCAGLMKDWLPP